MWRILRAEICYNKIIVGITCGIALFIIIVNSVRGWPNPTLNLRGTKAIMTVAVAVACFVSFLKFFKEKRERYLSILPLSIKEVGVSRLLFMGIVWLSLVLLFLIGSSTAQPYWVDNIIWDTLSLTGFIMMINAYIFIHRDLTIRFQDRYQKLILMILYSILIIMGYLVWYLLFTVAIPYFKFLEPLNQFKKDFPNVSSVAIGAIFFNLCGIGLTVLSIFIFKNRKTYLG